MNPKLKILIFIDWYLPAVKAGGPVRSVANLIQALHDTFDFYVVCSDRDLLDETPFQDIKLNTWQRVGEAQVMYTANDQAHIKYYKQLISTINPNTIYINGIFSWSFSIQALIASRSFKHIKTILAPRGMLGKGALAIKAKKKKIFLKLASFIRLYSKVTWHVTSEKEKTEVLEMLGHHISVHLLSNFSLIDNNGEKKIKLKSELHLVCVARISKIKNLEFSIALLKKLSLEGYTAISLAIYGPIEEIDYWEQIKASIKELKTITYKGVLNADSLSQHLNQYDAFILPTFHENYGHAIAEALGNGLPVIVSDQTPWRNLETHLAGFDISLTDETKFLESLKYFYNLDADEFAVWQTGAVNLFKQKIDLEKIKKQYITLFS